MKQFFKIFILILITEFVIVSLDNIAYQFFNQFQLLHKLLSMVVIILCCPLYFINKSFPFYANYNVFYTTLLILLNTFIQAFVIYLVTKNFKKEN